MTAASAVSLTGNVNEEVTETPTVLVRDPGGLPISGVAVRFTTDGRGSLVQGNVPTTDKDGFARVGRWTLGRVAGKHSLTATIEGTDQSVSFQAVAQPGNPASIQEISGNHQSSSGGAEVGAPLRVRVQDSFLNPLPGVEVLLVIASGGGSLVQPSLLTDAQGIATITGWKLGSLGLQSLKVSVEGGPTNTFFAHAFFTAVSCETSSVVRANETLNSVLNAESCTSSSGGHFKVFTVNSGGALEVSLSSPDFDTYLEIRNDHTLASAARAAGSNVAGIKTIFPPGAYTIVAASQKPGSSGTFSLSLKQADPVVNGCEEAYIARGTTTYQITTGYDCRIDAEQSVDRFKIRLLPGSQIEVVVDDLSYSNHVLWLTDPAGKTVSFGTASNHYVDTLRATAETDGFYTINVANTFSDWAAYNLTVR